MLRLRSWLLLGFMAVLALASIAVAHGVPSSSSFVSANNSGTIAKSKASTTTCTGTDGTYEDTRGSYTGTLSGDAGLAGPVEIRLRSWFNTTTHRGFLRGEWRIQTAGPGHSEGRLEAVNDNNTLAGWIEGNAGGGKQVMGTLAASWTKDGGFTSLQIGGAGTTERVVILASGHCAKGGDNHQGEQD